MVGLAKFEDSWLFISIPGVNMIRFILLLNEDDEEELDDDGVRGADGTWGPLAGIEESVDEEVKLSFREDAPSFRLGVVAVGALEVVVLVLV
jgi:hypothetical protein